MRVGKEPWIDLKESREMTFRTGDCYSPRDDSMESPSRDDSGSLDINMSEGHDGYDLVIAGAFPTLQGRVTLLRRSQLALSQLYIALTNTRPGGSCVMVCNTKTFSWIIELIGVLRRVFKSVAAMKGKTLHSRRSSCYLVCQGFEEISDEERENEGWGEGVDVEEYKQRVRDVLGWVKDRLVEVEASSESSAASGEGKSPRSAEAGEDSDDGDEEEPGGSELAGNRRIIVPMTLLLEYADANALYEGEHQAFLQLFEPIWEAQYQAMKDHMAILSSSSPRDEKNERYQRQNSAEGEYFRILSASATIRFFRNDIF